MATLSESLQADLSGYTAVDQPYNQAAHAASSSRTVPSASAPSVSLRCPLPPIYGSHPDSLRQFSAAGQVPQMRILAPK